MTQRLCIVFVLCLVWTAALSAEDAVPPKEHPDSSGWKDLFAADLSDAIYPEGIWSFQDGVLTATQDKNIWTKKEYGKCILDLEFKFAPAGNSGVFFYNSNMDNWVPNTVEVQILDDGHQKWANEAVMNHCGGIYGRLAPSKSAVKKADQWNRMTITCLGPKVYVLLNGEPVTELDMKKWTIADKNPDGSSAPGHIVGKPLAEMPTKGRLGLQGKHGGVPIYFRNIKIKPLESE